MRWALKQLALPLGGFAVGWGGWDALERNDLISQEVYSQLSLVRLQLMRFASLALPASFLGASHEEICSAIEQLNNPKGEGDNRLKFVEVLKQCRVQEQLEWMEEHAQEEIPFFFIADLFHAFALLHEPQAAAQLEDDNRFDSPILTRRTFEMMLSGVMPFDVACRVLAALASKSANNRSLLRHQLKSTDGKTSVSVILSEWLKFHDELKDKEEDRRGGEVVTEQQVNVSSAVLLYSMEKASKWHLVPLLRTHHVWDEFGNESLPRNSLCQLLQQTQGVLGDTPTFSFIAEGMRQMKCSNCTV